jgi:hypothetical protein
MTKVHQRRKLQYVFAVFTGTVVLAVALFSLVFYLPARAGYSDLESKILELRAGFVQRTAALESLEGAESRLANANESRSVFLSSNLVSREMGYAALLPDLDAMARRAGVERPGARYQISDEPVYGVYPVEILMSVSGDYASVRDFIEELERSERFFLIDSLTMGRMESGELEVELLISTFFADYHE